MSAGVVLLQTTSRLTGEPRVQNDEEKREKIGVCNDQHTDGEIRIPMVVLLLYYFWRTRASSLSKTDLGQPSLARQISGRNRRAFIASHYLIP